MVDETEFMSLKLILTVPTIMNSYNEVRQHTHHKTKYGEKYIRGALRDCPSNASVPEKCFHYSLCKE